MTTLNAQLSHDIKEAMRARDKKTLDTLRLISAAVKQIEVDERITVDDARMQTLLTKMAKQRNESIGHYSAAQRDDLVAQETFELNIIKHYLPAQLSETEITSIIDEAFDQVAVTQISDIGKLMALVKPKIENRADMSQVSQQVKAKLYALLG